MRDNVDVYIALSYRKPCVSIPSNVATSSLARNRCVVNDSVWLGSAERDNGIVRMYCKLWREQKDARSENR